LHLTVQWSPEFGKKEVGVTETMCHRENRSEKRYFSLEYTEFPNPPFAILYLVLFLYSFIVDTNLLLAKLINSTDAKLNRDINSFFHGTEY
jgi:hypothetical protein